MLALVQSLPGGNVPLQNALGRVLTRDIIAGRDQPPFAASAMDGYAVRSSDTPGNLRLIGESAAGHGFEGQCEAGMAVRISTGAAMPDGADTVVIQEDVRRDGDGITVPAAEAGTKISVRAAVISPQARSCFPPDAGLMVWRCPWRRHPGWRKSLSRVRRASQSSAAATNWRRPGRSPIPIRYSTPAPLASRA